MSDFSRRILSVFNRPPFMVIKTIWIVLADRLRAVLLMLLLAVGATASAREEVVLAPGLSLVPPSALSLQYVNTKSGGESLVLVGHIEGAPGYFLAAERVIVKQRVSVLWEKLEMEIRGRADGRSFEVNDRGVFLANSEAKVWYRAYQYTLDGVGQGPVYYLIRQNGQSYWLTLTTAESVDLEVVKPIVCAILKRVIIRDKQGLDGAPE